MAAKTSRCQKPLLLNWIPPCVSFFLKPLCVCVCVCARTHVRVRVRAHVPSHVSLCVPLVRKVPDQGLSLGHLLSFACPVSDISPRCPPVCPDPTCSRSSMCEFQVNRLR